MARTRRTSGDGTIRTRLSNSFVEALEADWQANKTAVIQALREQDVARYSELIGKLIVSEENAPVASDHSIPRNSDEIARYLLADHGLEHPDESAKARALVAYDTLLEALQSIADETIGPLQ